MRDFNDDSLTIIIWDVQHGNAIYINTPNGNHIIHDLGLGSFGSKHFTYSPLKYLQKKYGIDYLDFVIISHPHLDHLADILNLKDFTFKYFARPVSITEEDIIENIRGINDDYIKNIFLKYIELNDNYTHPVLPEEDPANPSVNGGVRIKIFSPMPDIKTNKVNRGKQTIERIRSILLMNIP